MRPLRSDHLAAWSRTFAVQGSWNYTTMVGTGVAYALLPLLRRIYAGDPVRPVSYTHLTLPTNTNAGSWGGSAGE